MKWIRINESKRGCIGKLAGGCKLHDLGDVFVVTDPHGKNIGECRTRIEAEGLAEEWCEQNQTSESKGSPIEIDYKKKELRELMEHLMKAEDEMFTFIQTGKRLVRNDKDGGYKDLEYCIHCAETAMENLSDTKIRLRDIQDVDETPLSGKLTNERKFSWDRDWRKLGKSPNTTDIYDYKVGDVVEVAQDLEGHKTKLLATVLKVDGRKRGLLVEWMDDLKYRGTTWRRKGETQFIQGPVFNDKYIVKVT